MEKSKQELIESGLRGNSLENLVEGWIFRVDERSSNLYMADGINKQGKTVSSFGVDPEKVLNDCLKKAERFNSRQSFFVKLKSIFTK